MKICRCNWNEAELNAYYDAGAREADQIQERLKAQEMGRREEREKAELEKEQSIYSLSLNAVSIEILAQTFAKTPQEIAQIISKYTKLS